MATAERLEGTAMSPAYVTSGDFNVIAQAVRGVAGHRLSFREYRLKQNPDQRSTIDLALTGLYYWMEAGKPDDEVFHTGASFIRVTRELPGFDFNADN